VSTHDTTFARATVQIFYLIWWETLKAVRNSKGGLRGMHTVCKFHMRDYFPWKVIIFKTIDLESSNVRFRSVF